MFWEWVRSTFLEPLPNHLSENMAMAYSYKGGEYWEQPFEILSNFSPAGALSSTGTDMAIFAQAILGGGQYEGRRILKKTTVDQMLNRNFSHDERLMGMALGFCREGGKWRTASRSWWRYTVLPLRPSH